MANAVLPYPDMDFTPLDILTAAEMDQMVANDQYLANFVNGLADGSNLSDGVIQARHFATLGMITISGNYGDSNASANSQISLNTVKGSFGDNLTLSGDAVKIGKGVNKILVSASTFYSSSGGAYGWCRINKNNSDTGLSAIANLTNSSYGTATICPVILNVVENDAIKLWNNDAAKVRGNSTYLTVIAIA